jgi:hypothetical protein
MRAFICLALFLMFTVNISPVSGAIDRIEKEDGERFVVGFLRLYYNIGKGLVDFTKTAVLSIPSVPRAVATDILNVGQKTAPSAYYMTEQERKERKRQKRLEAQQRKEYEDTLIKERGGKPGDKDNFMPDTHIKP